MGLVKKVSVLLYALCRRPNETLGAATECVDFNITYEQIRIKSWEYMPERQMFPFFLLRCFWVIFLIIVFTIFLENSPETALIKRFETVHNKYVV
jgi:hypothetical protein